MESKKLFFGIVLTLLVLSSLYFASAGDFLALQGNVNQDGVALALGNLTVVIYDSPSGGNLVYNSSSDFNGVISSGKYDVVLGNNSQELNLDYGKKYYMEMYVNGERFTFDGKSRQVFQSSVGNVSLDYVNNSEVLVRTDQSPSWQDGQNVSTGIGGWFKGLFNWVVGGNSQNYLSFNGSTLEFNETFLNITIDARASSSTYNATYALYAYNQTSVYTHLSNFTNDQGFITSTEGNTTYILQDNEANLNVNSSSWWASLSGWASGWFISLSNQLSLNETKLNESIDSRGILNNWGATYNSTYAIWAYNQTDVYTHLSNFTDDIGAASSYNETYALYAYNQTTGAITYADTTFLRKDGDNGTGEYNFNGGWANDGLTISNGDLYAQTLFVYNVTSLGVSTLNINGSLIPQGGFTNTFDIGSSDLNWRYGYFGTDVLINGNSVLGLFNNASYLSTYNASYESTYNATYAQWAYNQTNVYTHLSNFTNDGGFITSTQGNTTYLLVSNEANLNVNSSAFWDNLNSPSDIEGSVYWYNHTSEIITLKDAAWSSIYNSSYESTYNATYDAKNSSQWITSGGDIYYQNLTGRVGIGTNSPNDASLVVKSLALNSRIIKLLGSTDVELAKLNELGSGHSLFQLNNATGSASIVFRTDGSDNYINTGNVGIGTSSPYGNLQVVGSGSNQIVVNETAAGGAGTIRIGGTGSYATIRKYGTSHAKANTLGFSTDNGANDAMTIDSSGNVGIGTTNPTTKLELKGSSSQYLTFNSTDTVNQFDLQIGSTGGTGGGVIHLKKHNNEDAQVLIRGYGDSYFNAGNVGIGTSSPSANFHVYNLSGNVGQKIESGDSSNSVYSQLVNDAGKDLTFRVYGSSASGTLFGSNRANNTFIYPFSTSDLIIGTYSDKNVIFGQNNAEVMRISDNGNVGIGTSTPTNKLEIRGSSTEWIVINSSSTNNDHDARIGAINGLGGGITLQNSTGTSNVIIRGYGDSVFNAGKVGIGTTSPSVPLQVQDQILSNGSVAGIYFSDRANNSRQWAWYSNSDIANLWWNNPSKNVISVNGSSGNIGIGTGSPSQKLDVRGNGNFSGEIYFNNGTKVSSLGGGGSSGWTQSGNYIYNTTANIGIGTSSPETSLEVEDTASTNSVPSWMKIASTDQANDGVGIGTMSGTKAIYLYADSDSQLKLDAYDYGTTSALNITIAGNGGNVGIATTTPASKLTVDGDFRIQSSGVTKHLFTYSSGNSYYAGYNNSGVVDVLIRSGTGVSSYFNGGNVGIGTTTPTQKLNVLGAVNLSAGNVNPVSGSSGPEIILESNDGYSPGELYIYSAKGGEVGGNINLQVLKDGVPEYSSYILLNELGGKVGVGLGTPLYKFDVFGSSRLKGADGDSSGGGTLIISDGVGNTGGAASLTGGIGFGGGQVTISGGDGDLTLGGDVLISGGEGISGDGDVILAQSWGNVGIGTPNPTQKLNVLSSGGAINASGSTYGVYGRETGSIYDSYGYLGYYSGGISYGGYFVGSQYALRAVGKIYSDSYSAKDGSGIERSGITIQTGYGECNMTFTDGLLTAISSGCINGPA